MNTILRMTVGWIYAGALALVWWWLGLAMLLTAAVVVIMTVPGQMVAHQAVTRWLHSRYGVPGGPDRPQPHLVHRALIGVVTAVAFGVTVGFLATGDLFGGTWRGLVVLLLAVGVVQVADIVVLYREVRGRAAAMHGPVLDRQPY